jgi:hypothetical protein
VKRKVFLHVGAPKTGTTYLQDRLLRNRRSLSRHGISYPVGMHPDMFGAALDLIERGWGGQRDEVRGRWDELVKRVHRTRGDVIISHEILAAARPEQIARVMADLVDFEVHIIYTARDLGRQIPAEWQEQVKHQGRVPFKRYLRKVIEARQTGPTFWFWRVQSLPDVLTRWGSSLPPEQVHLITIPQPGAPRGELWERFCRVVGIDLAWAPADTNRANQSLGAAETTMVRLLNKRLRDRAAVEQGFNHDHYRDVVRGEIVHNVLAHREAKQPITLPPDVHAWAEETTEGWIEWVKGSQVHVEGDVDELRPRFAPPETPWLDPDNPSGRAVADATLDALVVALLEISRRPDPDATLRAQVGKTARRIRGRV